VWQGVSGGTEFLADTSPVLQDPHHLEVIQQSTGASNLITEIQKASNHGFIFVRGVAVGDGF